jgi:hypothetical protein
MSPDTYVTLICGAITALTTVSGIRLRQSRLSKEFHDHKILVLSRLDAIDRKLDALKAPSNGVHPVGDGH